MNNQATETLAAARAAVHASRVEHDTALAQLEAARTKYLADSTAKHQTAVISAEDSARFAEMRMTAATQKFEAARAAHDAAEKAARLEALRARQAAANLSTFDRAIASTVVKHAELLSKLEDVLGEEKRLISGFLSDQTSIARDAAALGAPASPALDFERIVQSRLMAATGKPAAQVLATVYSTRAPVGVSPDEALAAAERGVSPALVSAKLAALRDAVRRQSEAAVKVAQGLFVSGLKVDPRTTPLGQFEDCAKEIEGARLSLAELGFAKLADSEKSSELASRLQKAGPAKVEGLLRDLRKCEFEESVPGVAWPSRPEVHGHQADLAKVPFAALTALGFEAEASNVRPSARAHGVAPAQSPAGAFLNVGAQGL